MESEVMLFRYFWPENGILASVLLKHGKISCIKEFINIYQITGFIARMMRFSIY